MRTPPRIGCLPPSVEPRATEHIEEMISLVERLIERGHAYAAEGHVLFDVGSDPGTTARWHAALSTRCAPRPRRGCAL